MSTRVGEAYFHVKSSGKPSSNTGAKNSQLIIIIIIIGRNKIANIGYDRDETANIGYDRDQTLNYRISEYSKWAQKMYKTRHDWAGMVIDREMCKKFKFYHSNKWYLHNPASFLKDDTHKLLWDFDIQTDHLISARRPDLIIINNKENMQNCGLCCSGWLKNKTEGKWKEG